MKEFRSQDMQKQASALQEAAMREPITITYRDRPRLVMMSVDHYEALLQASAGRNQSSAGTSSRVSPVPNRNDRDFLIAYSREEISRNEAMRGIGIDPSLVASFAAVMNANGMPWPKVDREKAEQDADALRDFIEERDR